MCGRITKRGFRQGTVKGPVRPEAPTGRGMFTLNSRDLRMWFSMISRVIKDDFIPESDAQVASGFASLPNPVAFETEEQTLEMLHEREQNERDVLEALDEYK